MLSLPGRNGRRRRVLNDEVLSASSSHVALRAMADEQDAAYDAPRYSDAAGVENHPQVTDFVPRRYRTIALLVLAGVLTTGGLSTLHCFAASIARAGGLAHTGTLDLASPGSLATWIASSVLMVAGVACVLIYSIRRHRIDDYRGRYRIWLAAAAACILMSDNSVVSLHDVVAQSLSHHTGWTALRAGAAWWLVLAGLPLSWIAVRALIDVKECRLAALLLGGAVACYVVAAACFVGLIPTNDNQIATLTIGTATLLADWLLLASLVTYARFVVLDAQGLIPVVRRAAKPRGSKTTSTASASAPAEKPGTKRASLFSAAGVSRQTRSASIQPAISPASPDEWIDGSRAERKRFDEDSDDEDSGDDRKMSKADRKKLRKLKTRDRAA